ncbi:hypothetical protein DCAR_0102273 [Daucus carota subsp. sativus]|uniref:Uncharacterized protein n=1 Tax=Daucus carota subsp. sativus TaxID=79200 RepID=A0A166GZW6_DAUCS|nr:hypothetical protein DCAR_0102273 [Daucus carota subsp. sativus]
MGRAASHITLECALQTHPNITLIGEEVQHLIAELNEILANDIVDEDGLWKKKLAPQSLELFALLPPANQGKFKPVIRKAMVELDAAPFKKFASLHEEWAQTNCYISPGPIQFVGLVSDKVNHTLLLELGVEV